MKIIHQPAPFWARSLAHNIDLTLLLIPGFLLQYTLESPEWLKYVLIFSYGLYHAFWELQKKPSPGKYLLKLRIVTQQSGYPSTKSIIIRNLSRYLSLLPVGIGYLIAIFPPDYRALHDILARTRVIQLRNDEIK